MKEAADRMGFTDIIVKAGGQIVADTCMVVSPIEDMGYKTTGVNSGKAGNYLPGFCKQNVCFANLDKLLEIQRSVYGKLSLRPRFYEFERYAKVYDLRHPCRITPAGNHRNIAIPQGAGKRT
jgi:hypothetical protein